MIPIAEIAGVIHSARKPSRRFIVVFKFCCDESYDPPKVKAPTGSPRLEPKSYVVGGWFSDQKTWEKVEGRWMSKNERVRVSRFHASHLNAGTWEYDGWSKNRRLRYSKDMLKILKDQKDKLHGISIGLFVDKYRQLVSTEGQRKLGHPYLVCFKSVVAAIALQMEEGGFRQEDRFSVLLDRNDFEFDAVKTFYAMRDNPKFRYRHRLETCTPGDSESYAGLQTADFVAYETFRLMNGKRNGNQQTRYALSSMFGTTPFLGYQFEDETLSRINKEIETLESVDGGLVVIPPHLPDEPSEVSNDKNA